MLWILLPGGTSAMDIHAMHMHTVVCILVSEYNQQELQEQVLARRPAVSHRGGTLV